MRKPPYSFLKKNMDTFLCDEELNYFHSIASVKKYDFLAGRFAVKKSFQKLQLCQMRDIVVRYKNNKPYCILQGEKMHISISHIKNWVVSIASQNYIGIDIEQQQRRSREFEVFVANEDEYDILKTNLILEFKDISIAAWVIKEACLKVDLYQSDIRNYRIVSVNNQLISVYNSDTCSSYEVHICCYCDIIIAYTKNSS